MQNNTQAKATKSKIHFAITFFNRYHALKVKFKYSIQVIEHKIQLIHVKDTMEYNM